MRTIHAPLWMVTVGFCAAGCGEPTSDPGPQPHVSEIDTVPTVDKVDLLLVVDNSISMADKQAILAPSVRRLLTSLINPPCVDGSGSPSATQPAGPSEACPAGFSRASEPVDDLHVGIISSSLGDLGTGACGQLSLLYPDDKAHLLARGPGGGVVETYRDLGFLAWDPNGELSPPGESDFEALLQKAEQMILGVDEVGCGYEMPLEATYRFLADPDPYEELVKGHDGTLTRVGTDDVLLAQRAAFIRPDSFVGVVLLSDENDCSIDVATQGHMLFGAPFYRPTSACATDPNDPCCTSCGLPTPEGCAADPACDTPRYTQGEDHQNLKCWDQKRRYGVEFRYPTARYVNALSSPTIDPANPDLAPGETSVSNPLFASGRHVQHVSLTAIVGVPWQDLVVNPSDPTSALKTTSQMEADGTWSWIVGDAPADPFMVQSVVPRSDRKSVV